MNQYLQATLRFWWLVLAGIAAALMVPVLLLYQVKSLSPPKLVHRANPSYVAATQLLVDSPTGPYLRADARQVSPTPTTRSSSNKAPSTNPTPTTTSSEPSLAASDTKSLVSAANLFPLFVESDAVVAIRTRLIGNVPGRVTARALFSLENPNKFRPSPIPVMQILATAPRPKAAVLLADGTAKAFKIWLTTSQQRAHVPSNQRIVLRELNAARGAAMTGGSSYGLPLIAAFAVLAMFVGAAIAADRAWPRRLSRLQEVDHVGAASQLDGPVAEPGSLSVAYADHAADPRN
jgi:hypothetical protein